jgi:hypothetical protein
MPKKPKTKPAAKRLANKREATPEEREWMLETPAMLYSLEACFDQHQQQIDLTMDEYDALKAHLVKLRGLEVSSKEAANA